jgi:hypothetical protein
MLTTLIDKRLYLHSFFFHAFPFIIIGLSVEVLICIALNPSMLLIYLLVFGIIILVSGLGAKNYFAEVYAMGRFEGFLFLLSSMLASSTPFVLLKPTNSLNYLFLYLLIFTISTSALILSIIEITIRGQRVSLRQNINITKDFFDKQKKSGKNNYLIILIRTKFLMQSMRGNFSLICLIEDLLQLQPFGLVV